jgi:deferrochelatase/peroxidase EfeB
VIAAPVLDKKQVQRLIVRACTLDHSRHLVLQVTGPSEARRFLGGLLAEDLVDDASLEMDDIDLLKKRGCLLNIGFTYRGLEQLGVGPAHRAVFQMKTPAFVEGACRRAARRLGDTGKSAAPWWENVFEESHAHMLITLHAAQQDELEACTEKLHKEISGAAGLAGWGAPIDGAHLTDNPRYRKVHFGLRDLVADPGIDGFPPDKRHMHAPGEFLLGYTNDDKFNSWLLRNPSRSPNPWLLPLSPIMPEFFWNGSFAAFRKMQQHEKKFRESLARWATALGVTQEYLKAKLTGRWEHGQLVKPGETVQPARSPDDEDLDDFDFGDDPEGKGCPFGSHIRRMNPRSGKVVPARKRTLIRRGMPYGPLYEDAPDEDAPDEERGLLGLFFCASLEDQFEHLIAEWGNANPMGPVNRGNAKDAFLSGYGQLRAMFDIPVDGEQPCRFESFTPFVTTRGTLYAFFPGMTALRALADGKVKE